MLSHAAQMRREPTEPERRLWKLLRASQLDGFKFRRQATIEARIVDFFCRAKGLIVEIDGETHEAVRDVARDHEMLSTGSFQTIRIANHDVMHNPDGVLQAILQKLKSMPDRWPGDTTPGPSSEEEGRESLP